MMNQKYLKSSGNKICLVLMVLLTIMSASLLSACSNTVSVNMIIEYPKDENLKKVNVEDIEVDKDTTAFDVLKKYAGENNIEIIYTGDPERIESINGIEVDWNKHWVLEINGKAQEDPHGSVELEDGDNIVWKYLE